MRPLYGLIIGICLFAAFSMTTGCQSNIGGQTLPSGYYLNDRRNWHLVSRHEIYKVKGLYIHREPQRYSIWTYDPVSHPLSN